MIWFFNMNLSLKSGKFEVSLCLKIRTNNRWKQARDKETQEKKIEEMKQDEQINTQSA